MLHCQTQDQWASCNNANVFDSPDRSLRGTKKFSSGASGVVSNEPRPHWNLPWNNETRPASEAYLPGSGVHQPPPRPPGKLRIHTPISVINTELITCQQNIHYVDDSFVFQRPSAALLPLLPASPFSPTFDRSCCSVLPLLISPPSAFCCRLSLWVIWIEDDATSLSLPHSASLAAALLIRATTRTHTHTHIHKTKHIHTGCGTGAPPPGLDLC